MKNKLQDKTAADVAELLTAPLHEALAAAGNFTPLNKMQPAQQLLLAIDYISAHVRQGGFIQLIQNGYTELIVVAIEAAQKLNIGSEMVSVMDRALLEYVTHKDVLNRETTVQEFAALYAALPHFAQLDAAFESSAGLFYDDLKRLVIEEPWLFFQ